jgi:Tfp pilus assembly protein PilX
MNIMRTEHLNLQAQRGAALIVGLILMTVLTVLAISTMRTATVELSMAGNTQYRAKAQALAEAGLADAIAKINNRTLDPDAGLIGWQAFIPARAIDQNADDTYLVEILYRYEGNVPGTSENIVGQYFELKSTGQTAARNARVVLRKGFWKFAD